MSTLKNDGEGWTIIGPDPNPKGTTAKRAIRRFYNNQSGITPVCYVLEGEWIIDSPRMIVWHWDSNIRCVKVTAILPDT
jgi:hypothetical protein